MTIWMFVRTIFELFLFVAVAWGVFHEDRLIVFERGLIAALRRRRLHVVKAPYAKKKILRQ